MLQYDDSSTLPYLGTYRLCISYGDNVPRRYVRHLPYPSWLTVGKEVAEIALKSGANDMGSIMIEENVVSSAGATTRFDKEAMQATIRRAGFKPQLRDQLYNYRELK